MPSQTLFKHVQRRKWRFRGLNRRNFPGRDEPEAKSSQVNGYCSSTLPLSEIPGSAPVKFLQSKQVELALFYLVLFALKLWASQTFFSFWARHSQLGLKVHANLISIQMLKCSSPMWRSTLTLLLFVFYWCICQRIQRRSLLRIYNTKQLNRQAKRSIHRYTYAISKKSVKPLG